MQRLTEEELAKSRALVSSLQSSSEDTSTELSALQRSSKQEIALLKDEMQELKASGERELKLKEGQISSLQVLIKEAAEKGRARDVNGQHLKEDLQDAQKENKLCRSV